MRIEHTQQWLENMLSLPQESTLPDSALLGAPWYSVTAQEERGGLRTLGALSPSSEGQSQPQSATWRIVEPQYPRTTCSVSHLPLASWVALSKSLVSASQSLHNTATWEG